MLFLTSPLCASRHHLLLKFGSAEGVVGRSSDSSTQNAFFAVYNLETTDILGFFQNSSEDFLASFERFSDHFRVMPEEPAWMRFVSSYANNVYAREHLRKQKAACMGSKAGGNSQVRWFSAVPMRGVD
jgi:de-etiolated-1